MSHFLEGVGGSYRQRRGDIGGKKREKNPTPCKKDRMNENLEERIRATQRITL
jgi:hypothetical protein